MEKFTKADWGLNQWLAWLVIVAFFCEAARNATHSPRGRGVRGGINDGDGKWNDFGDALATPCAGSMRIPPNIDPEGQYNVDLADLPRANLVIPAPVPNIDAENEDAANADLNLVLLLGQVVGLPHQMERDEANRPQDLSSIAEMGVAPPNMASSDIAGGDIDTLLPEIVAPLDAAADANHGVGLPKCTEDATEVGVDIEVDVDASLPRMLELISAAARLGPRFASASMTMPDGDLESNLEERMPLDYPEGGNSPAELQAEVNIQNDVENVEVEEPNAKGTQ